jgi:toxin ParE1/3/4
MAQVIWAPSALDDIDSIAEYIAQDSPETASLFINRLMEATDRLQEFPLSGRIIPEINNPNCREVIYGAYRIMYRVEGDEVWITGVVHGARDWRQERSSNEEGSE